MPLEESKPAEAAKYTELQSALERILAPMVESDRGELFLVSATEQLVVLHLRGRFAGCPGNGLVAEQIISPLVQAALPGARLELSSGAILPSGATRVEAKIDATPHGGSDHASV